MPTLYKQPKLGNLENKVENAKPAKLVRTALHIHTYISNPSLGREDYLKRALLSKYLTQASIKNVKLLAITNIKDNLEQVILEEIHKGLIQKNKIEKVSNAMFVYNPQGDNPIFLLRGMEWHVYNTKAGHVCLIGINKQEPVHEELSRYDNILDVVKYSNDVAALTVLCHPFSKLSGGVDESMLKKLLTQESLSFALELNPTVLEFNILQLQDVLAKKILKYSAYKPIVASQDSHDGLLTHSYTLVNEQVFSNMETIPEAFASQIYNNKHGIEFKTNPLTHTLTWVFAQRCVFEPESIVKFLIQNLKKQLKLDKNAV